jgi:hypothetical protein
MTTTTSLRNSPCLAVASTSNVAVGDATTTDPCLAVASTNNVAVGDATTTDPVIDANDVAVVERAVVAPH